MPELLPLSPDADFTTVTRQALAMLREQVGFDLWTLTRVQGDQRIRLETEDHGYGVEPGSVTRWSDSVCARMVSGDGPQVAPDAMAVPAYRDAPIAQELPIGAYIGVPVKDPEGNLFGTLCGVHPEPQPDDIAEQLPVVKMVASLLGRVLESERRTEDLTRRLRDAELQATEDALTGMTNRRGWDRLLAAEEERCRRYGDPACVLSIDLDGLKAINDGQGHAAGDDMICRAAETILATVRENDVAARVGGDEFLVFGEDCDEDAAASLETRIRRALIKAGISASVGRARRDPRSGLVEAVREADAAMYAEKAGRRGGAAGGRDDAEPIRFAA